MFVAGKAFPQMSFMITLKQFLSGKTPCLFICTIGNRSDLVHKCYVQSSPMSLTSQAIQPCSQGYNMQLWACCSLDVGDTDISQIASQPASRVDAYARTCT